jgi:23S rRNA pseudouridine2605 synthase
MDDNNKNTPPSGQRIARVIARAGLASRREAEAWIAAGRVALNGKAITSPAVNIGPRDTVTVDGKALPKRERTRLFLFHKPRGLVTTNADPEGRPTIFSVLPKTLPRLISVGRLDLNTEGLLLLTNDGGLARVLEHPQTGWLRRYRVRARGTVTQVQLDALRKGITVDGVRYGPIEARLDRPQGANVWLTFAIREGKNREVRNVLGALDLQVNRLLRVSFGPFQLGELADGAVEEVPTRVLREQLGRKVTLLADADFDAPLQERAEPKERVPVTHPEEPRRGRGVLKGEGPGPHPRTRSGAGPARSTEPGHKPATGRPGGRPPQEDERPRGKARPWRGRDRELPVAEREIEGDAPRKTTSGLLTDRKGRRILVQRTKSDTPPEPPRRGTRDAQRPRHAQDRRKGPRPSRPAPPRDKR